MPKISIIGDKRVGKTTMLEMLYLIYGLAVKDSWGRDLGPLPWASLDGSFEYRRFTLDGPEEGRLYGLDDAEKPWTFRDLLTRFKKGQFALETKLLETYVVKFTLNTGNYKFVIETVDVSGDLIATYLLNKDLWTIEKSTTVDENKFIKHLKARFIENLVLIDRKEIELCQKLSKTKESKKEFIKEEIERLRYLRQMNKKYNLGALDVSENKERIMFAVNKFVQSLNESEGFVLLIDYTRRNKLERVIDNTMISTAHRYKEENRKKMCIAVSKCDVLEKKHPEIRITNLPEIWNNPSDTDRDSNLIFGLDKKMGQMGYSYDLFKDTIGIPKYSMYAVRADPNNPRKPFIYGESKTPICAGVWRPIDYLINTSIENLGE